MSVVCIGKSPHAVDLKKLLPGCSAEGYPVWAGPPLPKPALNEVPGETGAGRDGALTVVVEEVGGEVGHVEAVMETGPLKEG